MITRRLLRPTLRLFSTKAPKIEIASLLNLKEKKPHVTLPDELVEEKRTDEGILLHDRFINDDKFLTMISENHPGVERRSAYYTLVKDGRRYHVFNADRKAYGEIVTRAAVYLMGKHKPTFRRNQESEGDIVVIVNAEKLFMRKKFLKTKNLKYHTGIPGGLKVRYFKDLMFKKPETPFIHGVFKILPKTRLRYTYLKNLHINTGPLPRDFPFLPGFTPTPHPDRNQTLDLSLDPTKSKILYKNHDEPLIEELKDIPTDYMPYDQIFPRKDNTSLPIHIEKQLRKYNKWVRVERNKAREWRAKPPREPLEKSRPFKDSYAYYFSSEKQFDRYPFLREYFDDNKEIGEESEKD